MSVLDLLLFAGVTVACTLAGYLGFVLGRVSVKMGWRV